MKTNMNKFSVYVKRTHLDFTQSGYSLIELMVGLVIGLIASLIIMQTFSVFEGNKRGTTGIADAQTAGSIGLFMVQRELQYAGYGVPLTSGTLPTITAASAANTYSFVDYKDKTPQEVKDAQDAAKAAYDAKIAADKTIVSNGVNFSALNCTTAPAINIKPDEGSSRPNITNVIRDIITPVIITDGATSDTITIHYGDTQLGALGTDISGAPSGTQYVPVDNNVGCRQNDVVLVTRDGSNNCYATKVISTNAQLTGTINAINVLSHGGALQQGDKLACLGNVREVRFDVSGNQLRKTNRADNTQTPVLNEVVSLQAQYGLATTSNSEVVTSWQSATGTWAPSVISVADRNRIKAVRIAIVARNNLLEKETVTQLCNGAATGPARLCVFGGNLDLTAVAANWTNYRYRVYEVVVPLRNMLAASPQL
jgi:type IV pilus assembly protein PilW